ncbi:hypothetical protein [Mesorhizobium vachelliae]|uniref:hypothetical protein n=1 Tax=Mesorhizobium vachelliae TaxID=3072309 RepID=UPI003221D524
MTKYRYAVLGGDVGEWCRELPGDGTGAPGRRTDSALSRNLLHRPKAVEHSFQKLKRSRKVRHPTVQTWSATRESNARQRRDRIRSEYRGRKFS